MGIENLSLIFDHKPGVFYAGHHVTGHISFYVTKTIDSDGVFVRFCGRADTQWSEQRTTGTGDNRRTETVHYRGKEVYIDTKWPVFTPPGRRLEPGITYTFPFGFQLPPNIPSSFVGRYGKIRYYVEGHVHRSGLHMATKRLLNFSVVGIRDLNYFPNQRNPMTLSNSKTFGVLFWKSKPLTAEITLNKQAFVSGEHILLSGLINNQSDTKIKHIDLKLIKGVVFRAQGSTRRSSTTVYECRQPGIEKEAVAKWSDVKVFVPCLPPSSLDGCRLIDVNYLLQVRIVPPGAHFALELEFPVNIGTIPYRDMAPWAPPPAGAGYAPPGGAGYAPPAGVGTDGPSGFVMVGGTPATGAPAEPPSAPPAYFEQPPAYEEQAGPLPGKKDGAPYGAPYGAPSAPPGVPPSAPPGAPGSAPSAPPPTSYGEYCSDASAPPSYEDLFQGGNEEGEDDSRAYQPRYPTFNFNQQ